MPDNSLLQSLLNRLFTQQQGPDPNDNPQVPQRSFDGGDLTVGGLHNRLHRENARDGLPGSTPPIDPRLVNPNNDPRLSTNQLLSGDLQLPPRALQDVIGPHWDMNNGLNYFDALAK